jgi:hypothetical protein
MTRLWFHHDGLRKLSDALERAHSDAGAVQRHLLAADLQPGTVGLLNEMATHHYRAREVGPRAAKRISNRNFRLAVEIDEAAKWYQRTDLDAAREMDAEYPDVDIPPERRTSRYEYVRPPGFVGPIATPEGPRPPSSFPDAVEPRDALQTPIAGDKGDFQWQINWLTDIVSPAGLVRHTVVEIFGHDPFEWFLKQISGDWNGLWECGESWHQAGRALVDIAGNVHAMAANLPTVWEGDAADACQKYVYELASGIREHAKLFSAVGDHYWDAARTAWKGFEALGVVLQSLVDSVIAIAVASTAAGGNLPALPAGAMMFFRALKWYYEAHKAWAKVWDNIVAIGGAMTVTLNVFNDPAQQRAALPPEPYNHPAVQSAPEARGAPFE